MSKFEPGSFFQAPKAIFEMKEKPYIKLVGLYLFRLAHNDPNNSCFPGYADISKQCGISRSSAMRSISRLEEMGVIVRAGVKKGKYGPTNIYCVNGVPSVSQTLVSHRHQYHTDTTTSVSLTPPIEKTRHEVVSARHPINKYYKQIVDKQGETIKTNDVGRARQAPKGETPLEPPATVANKSTSYSDADKSKVVDFIRVNPGKTKRQIGDAIKIDLLTLSNILYREKQLIGTETSDAGVPVFILKEVAA